MKQTELDDIWERHRSGRLDVGAGEAAAETTVDNVEQITVFKKEWEGPRVWERTAGANLWVEK